MVAIKNLLFVASLLVSEIIAAPTADAVVERDLSAGLDKRNLDPAGNANDIRYSQYANFQKIKDNGGKATITDLTGCTAVFFFMDKTLRNAAHILCGNEEKDGEQAAKNAGGSDSVTIGANTQKRFDDVKAALLKGNKNLKFNEKVLYDIPTDTKKAVEFTAENGKLTIDKHIGDKKTKQQPS